MERRLFIRLVGGGCLAAALPGCSTALPPEALAAWAGPPATEGDPRRWALAHALLAPSSHNRQPWRVDLRQPDAITLHVDRERLLPETDPWYRQIVVSQGTFLELLVIALKERGVSPQVELFPEGEFAPRALDDRPVARVRWDPAAAAPARDPLFAHIRRRHTAKVAFDTERRVDATTLQSLSTAWPAEAPQGIRWGHTVEGGRVGDLRALCIESARVEVGTPRTALESARLMRIGPEEISRHRDGISVNGLVPRAATALGLFDRSTAPEPGSGAFDQVMKRFQTHADTAMGFVWITTDSASDRAAGRSRSAEVWAGRAYVRQQLQATALGLQMHPMSQAPQEFAEMAPHYQRLHTLLTGRADGSTTVQMFSRVGYSAPVQPAPRRPLDSLLRS
jgi:nitroreductase